MRRSLQIIALSLVALPLAATGAQNSRSVSTPDSRVVPLPTRQPDDPPMVWVRTNNGETQPYRFGEPIRITFEADRDAFVVIGRVDMGGEVSVIFPQRPDEQAAVYGRTRYYVDTRPWQAVSAWAGIAPSIQAPISTLSPRVTSRPKLGGISIARLISPFRMRRSRSS